VKVLEGLVLPLIVSHLPPAQHQHGFRPAHSTTSALLHLSTAITNGFNHPKPALRTIAVALDLTKAFDSVDLTSLISRLASSTLPGWTCRWLSAYLRGRETKCSFQGTQSKCFKVKTGVPQGSVISPALFNAYVSDLPQPPTDINLISYADDITIYSSNSSVPAIEQSLNTYLQSVSTFLGGRKLMISAQKTTCTLFTPETRQHSLQLNLFIEGERLVTVKHPKILGLIFDPSHTFNKYVDMVKTKMSKRNNILKALAGRSWGCAKETLLTTYKAIGRSVLNYAAPVWTPLLRFSNLAKLQISQNSALRIITG